MNQVFVKKTQHFRGTVDQRKSSTASEMDPQTERRRLENKLVKDHEEVSTSTWKGTAFLHPKQIMAGPLGKTRDESR